VQDGAAGRARTDLANWRVFEQAKLRTFRGMYQFWAQAKDLR